MRLQDTRYKQFDEGLQQLEEEGLMQVFYVERPPRADRRRRRCAAVRRDRQPAAHRVRRVEIKIDTTQYRRAMDRGSGAGHPFARRSDRARHRSPGSARAAVRVGLGAGLLPAPASGDRAARGIAGHGGFSDSLRRGKRQGKPPNHLSQSLADVRLFTIGDIRGFAPVQAPYSSKICAAFKEGLIACSRIAAFGFALSVAAPALAADAKPVTFSKDIAPIFQAKCQECHQPNSIAPMSLITFQDARPWARAIKERVAARQMPPWHIDRAVGVQKFKNDMSLSDDQVDAIVRWVDGGALQGDPKDLPKPKPLVTDNQWQGVRDGFGPPDIVVRSPDYTMAAEHQDVWFRPMSDHAGHGTALGEDGRDSSVEPQGAQDHPSLDRVSRPQQRSGRGEHGHRIGPGRGFDDATDLVNRRPQLMEWAIGKGYDLYRPGTGKLIVPGEKISWDQHIHAVGEEVTGGSEVGIWFYKKGEEPKKRSYLIGFTGIDRSKMLDIPPNSMAMTEGFTVLKENALIENFQPHFHLRGKAMQVEAILPDGSRQIISYVGNFNFNWMTNYIYDDDAAPLLPKGDRHPRDRAVRQHHARNKNNPDPDQWVGYGDRTVDEMAHAWMNVSLLQRRRVQGAAGRAQGEAREDHQREQREAAVNRFGFHCAAGLLAGGVFVSAQVHVIPEPRRGSGRSVTGAFEGWVLQSRTAAARSSSATTIATRSRRSTSRSARTTRSNPAVPTWDNRRIFFPAGSGACSWCPCRSDFKPTDSYVWTITANNQTTSIPLRLKADYVMSPFTEIAVGNTPPLIKLDENGPGTRGPLANLATAPARTASLASPFALTFWASDDMKCT